eukprot:3831253-Rhodomonas_salina.1
MPLVTAAVSGSPAALCRGSYAVCESSSTPAMDLGLGIRAYCWSVSLRSRAQSLFQDLSLKSIWHLTS